MKKQLTTISLLIILISSAFTQNSSVSGLNSLLENEFEEKSLNIERTAALEFHRLINQYRNENSLPLLAWDDTMWVAARNHSLWMFKNSRLSHHEFNTALYTGKNPEDRYYYASEGNPKFSINGENCLFNFSCKGKDVQETAINIAKESFEQWKSSPGHDQNMLSPGFIRHGVAFCVNGDNVWATDLFSSGYKSYKKENLSAKKSKHIEADIFNIQAEILENVLDRILHALRISPKQNNKMNDEANRNVKAIINVKPTTKETQNIILAKQENFNTKGVLGYFSKQKQIYSVVIEKKTNDFNIELVTNELIAQLMENQQLEGTKSIGMSIAIVKRKDKVRIALVSILTT